MTPIRQRGPDRAGPCAGIRDAGRIDTGCAGRNDAGGDHYERPRRRPAMAYHRRLSRPPAAGEARIAPSLHGGARPYVFGACIDDRNPNAATGWNRRVRPVEGRGSARCSIRARSGKSAQARWMDYSRPDGSGRPSFPSQVAAEHFGKRGGRLLEPVGEDHVTQRLHRTQIGRGTARSSQQVVRRHVRGVGLADTGTRAGRRAPGHCQRSEDIGDA